MQELVEAARKGAAGDADRLIRAVWPRAYRIALSVLGEPTLAEDAAQEACAILFRSIKNLRATAAFSVWFYRIVVREARACERRSRPAADEAASFESEEIDSSLRRIDLLAALRTLTAAQRIVIALYYYAELTTPEIAQALGLADSSVRFHLMRGRRALEKELRTTESRETPRGVA